METLSPMSVSAGELIIALSQYAIMLAVAVASYRRSRYLSGYPVWRSVIIGVFAGSFWFLWMIVWWVNRDRIAAEWHEYKTAKPLPSSR
jgi:hypothetical protein